jgi:hypothetical protein
MARHAHAHSRRLTYPRAMLPPLFYISLQSRSSFSWRERGGEEREGRRRVAFQTRPHRRGGRPSRPRASTRIDIPHQRGSGGALQ